MYVGVCIYIIYVYIYICIYMYIYVYLYICYRNFSDIYIYIHITHMISICSCPRKAPRTKVQVQLECWQRLRRSWMSGLRGNSVGTRWGSCCFFLRDIYYGWIVEWNLRFSETILIDFDQQNTHIGYKILCQLMSNLVGQVGCRPFFFDPGWQF